MGKNITPYASFDATVSGFAIHHQPDIRKQMLYAEIYEMLIQCGIFINIEHIAPETAWIEERFNELFIDLIVAHNQKYNIDMSTDETATRYRERDRKNVGILAPLDDQIDWMRSIGFQQLICYLKIFELAVFGGICPDV